MIVVVNLKGDEKMTKKKEMKMNEEYEINPITAAIIPSAIWK